MNKKQENPIKHLFRILGEENVSVQKEAENWRFTRDIFEKRCAVSDWDFEYWNYEKIPLPQEMYGM